MDGPNPPADAGFQVVDNPQAEALLQLAQVASELVKVSAAQAAQAAAPAATGGDAQPKNIAKNIKVTLDSLPDPRGEFKAYQRAVDEFIYEYKDFDSVSDFKLGKAIKDALPEALRGPLEDAIETKDIGLESVRKWVQKRCEENVNLNKLNLIKEFEKFTRSSHNIQNYIDTFEHHVQKLKNVGHKLEDPSFLLISKARLDEHVEAELVRVLHNKLLYTALEATYEDTRAQLLLLGKSTKQFVQVHATNVADNAQQQQVAPTPKQHEPGQLVCSHYTQGKCHFGDSCKHMHAMFSGKGKGKDMQHRGKGNGGKGKWGQGDRGDRSRSRTPFSGDRSRSRGQGDQPMKQEICRNYQNFRCNRGNDCYYKHVPSTGNTQQRQFSGRRTRSRSPRFGNSGSEKGSPPFKKRRTTPSRDSRREGTPPRR